MHSSITPSPAIVIVTRIADARLARYGVHERIQSTEFTRFEIPHPAAEFSFVELPCWEEGKKKNVLGKYGRI